MKNSEKTQISLKYVMKNILHFILLSFIYYNPIRVIPCTVLSIVLTSKNTNFVNVSLILYITYLTICIKLV